MTDARKMAEEALAKWDALPSGDVDDLAAWDVARDGMELFRALLASEPAPPAGAEVARLTALLRECNAVCLCGCPDSEHEADECGESCGNDDHECIRVPRAVLAYVERLRSAAPPAGAEVREAAEALLDDYAGVEDMLLPDTLEKVLRLRAALRGGQKGEA